jgi:hypothetical protein
VVLGSLECCIFLSLFFPKKEIRSVLLVIEALKALWVCGFEARYGNESSVSCLLYSIRNALPLFIYRTRFSWKNLLE